MRTSDYFWFSPGSIFFMPLSRLRMRTCCFRCTSGLSTFFMTEFPTFYISLIFWIYVSILFSMGLWGYKKQITISFCVLPLFYNLAFRELESLLMFIPFPIFLHFYLYFCIPLWAVPNIEAFLERFNHRLHI